MGCQMKKKVQEREDPEHKWWHRPFVLWRETETVNGNKEYIKYACVLCGYEKMIKKTYRF